MSINMDMFRQFAEQLPHLGERAKAPQMTDQERVDVVQADHPCLTPNADWLARDGIHSTAQPDREVRRLQTLSTQGAALTRELDRLELAPPFADADGPAPGLGHLEVVALALGALVGRTLVAGRLGHPHPAVVAQALAHQGQLALEGSMDRDAGGVDLGKTGVGEKSTFLIGAVRRGHVGGHGVGGEEKNVAVSAGAQYNGVGGMALDLARNQVADHDTLGMAAHQNHIQHFAAGEHLHLADGHLAHHGAVGAQQQLLAGLAPGIEGTGHLGAAEGAVGQQAAVIAGEGNALGHALVDNVVAHLGQAVDVGLASAKIPALDRIDEQSLAIRTVPVLLNRDRAEGLVRDVLSDLIAHGQSSRIKEAMNEVLATMLGNFQGDGIAGKMQLGSGWWFLDQMDGMIRQMNALSNLGLLSRFVGMLTDSRSFLSFPRHEYFRRILCDLLGADIENGEMPAVPFGN